MIGSHKGFAHANFPCVAKSTRNSAAPGIAQQWPTLLLIKLGRITMHRFTEALEPFGIRPRHVAALIELRDRGEGTQQSLCSALHLDPTPPPRPDHPRPDPKRPRAAGLRAPPPRPAGSPPPHRRGVEEGRQGAR